MENTVPLTQDLLVDTPLLEIIRGLEGLQRVDETIADGESFAEGDWAVLNNDGELEAPGATPVKNCFPVWAGNSEGRSDVAATGKATILKGGRFIYRTSKYDKTQSYAAGDELTVKDLGAGERVPTKAAGAEVVLAVVDKVVGDFLEIEVVR
jgi:hypothetical protein